MLHLADVSEFQGVIDWPTYGKHYPAVIVRAHNGSRPDRKWAANRDGARANVAIRGWYQYLTNGADAAKQAAGFCNTLGSLVPGEFAAVDIEEGNGSQVERAQAWMAVVDKRLATRSWLYTGQAFAQAHLGSLAPFHDRHVWLANYRSRPPDLPCTLWQHTDAEAHAGIVRPCDCSIFQGTTEEFAAIVARALHAQVAPNPIIHAEEADMAMIVLDPKGRDDQGRDSHWEVTKEGNVKNWNGARPLKSLHDLGVTASIVAAVADPSGDGLVMMADDAHQDDRGHWVRSTYKILVSV